MSTRRAASDEPPAERAALIRLVTRATRHHDADVLLDELSGLARAAGATVVWRGLQERAQPDPATLIGSGKAEALADVCRLTHATVAVFDNELTPAQTRNLEGVLGCRVVDRTAVILDIFARRARTREGKLQVELAQLQYMLPRLAGSGTALSRLGGGIGTRGPGETKLETDRRRIRHRVAALKREIAEVRHRRGHGRARRRRTEIPTVALVGYTNAGKTTLFNALTGDASFASSMLFATLDPCVRRIKLPDARQIAILDTVGFIDRLPHQLVAAFHATLEAVADADLLVHVVDAAAPDRERRMAAVQAVLEDVGAGGVPMLEVFNKCDLLGDPERERIRAAPDGPLCVSGRTGEGRADLVAAIALGLGMDAARVRLEFDEGRDRDRRLVADLYRHAQVLSHVSSGGRVVIEADVPRRFLARFEPVGSL